MKMQYFESQTAEVYIFDSFAKSDEICKRMRETELFVSVYYIHDSDYIKPGRFIDLKAIFDDSKFKKILSEKSYEQIFVYNIYGIFIDLIFNVLKERNQNMIFNVIEDGPSLYYIEKIIPKTQKYLYPFLGLKVPIDHINYWWFSMPEKMWPFGNGKKRKLPVVDKKNIKLVNAINFVFQYTDSPVLSKAKILIMEECYWNDGLLKSGADYALYKKIKDTFADCKVAVKLHPRTRHNRFRDEFEALPSNGIPWEVYALNVDMSNKILISLSCATMVSSKLLFNEETYSLLLYPIIEREIITVNTGKPYLSPERKQKIDSQQDLYANKDKFQKAVTLEAAYKVLRNWLNGQTPLVE